MNLKNFHLLLIAVSALLSLGLAASCFLTEDGRAAPGSAIMGAISAVAFVALVVYGVYFVAKMKRERIR